MKNGAAIAASPIARLTQAGRGHERSGEEARDRDAVENAEGDGLAGREDEAACGHQRRRASDDREPAPEGPNVQPVAMGKRQRHANQEQERARHHVRQQPHLRRERQHWRGKPEIGQVPAQVVDGHAHERQTAGAIDGVDAARSVLMMGGVAQRALIRPFGPPSP